jgi:hypothetical protein
VSYTTPSGPVRTQAAATGSPHDSGPETFQRMFRRSPVSSLKGGHRSTETYRPLARIQASC